jgi:hypothetical protein
MVDPERLELPTPAFEAQCSIQLSYGSNLFELNVLLYCSILLFFRGAHFGATCGRRVLI